MLDMTRLMSFAVTSLDGSERLLMAGMGTHWDQRTEWLIIGAAVRRGNEGELEYFANQETRYELG